MSKQSVRIFIQFLSLSLFLLISYEELPSATTFIRPLVWDPELPTNIWSFEWNSLFFVLFFSAILLLIHRLIPPNRALLSAFQKLFHYRKRKLISLNCYHMFGPIWVRFDQQICFTYNWSARRTHMSVASTLHQGTKRTNSCPPTPFLKKWLRTRFQIIQHMWSTGVALYSTSHARWPEKQKLRQETIFLRSLSEVFFLRSILKRKSEVLTQQQKVFKNRLFEMCQYVVPVVRSSEKGRPLLRPRCQKARLFHYTQPKTIHASH